MTRSRITAAGLVMAGALALAAGPATSAAPMSPFRAMAGSWSGGGVLDMADGQQERLRCRASYDVAGAERNCASSYNFDLTSQVQYQEGAISGEWSEASRNASGTIEGRASGDRVEAAARGQNFSAALSLTTRGNRQSVSIRPEGTDVRAVSLSLERR
jgi:hypothetical protein